MDIVTAERGAPQRAPKRLQGRRTTVLATPRTGSAQAPCLFPQGGWPSGFELPAGPASPLYAARVSGFLADFIHQSMFFFDESGKRLEEFRLPPRHAPVHQPGQVESPNLRPRRRWSMNRWTFATSMSHHSGRCHTSILDKAGDLLLVDARPRAPRDFVA